jgi:hypothetical protein
MMAIDVRLTSQQRELRLESRKFAADVLASARAAELLPTPEERFRETKPVYEAMVAAGFLRKWNSGQKRIDQQGLLLAVDQRGRIRYFQIILAGRNPLGRTPALPDEQLPLDGFRHWRTTKPKTCRLLAADFRRV